MSILHAKIRRIRSRLTLMQFITFAVRGLFFGLCLVAFYTLLIKFIPLDVGFYRVVLSILAAAVVVSLAGALYFRPSLLQAAIAADGVLGYEERLSSACILYDETMPMVAQLHGDAENHAKKIDVSKSFRPRLPRGSYTLIIPLAAAILISAFMKEMDIFKRRQSIAERNYVQKKIRSEIKRLENTATKLRKESEKYESEELLKAAQNIDDTIKELHSGKFKKKQVMAKLTKLSDRMSEMRDKMDRIKDLRDILKETSSLSQSKDFADAINRGDYSAAKDALKKMQESLASGEMSKSQMEKLAAELKSLSDAMAQKTEMKELSEALAKMASAMSAQCKTGSMSQQDFSKTLSEMSQMAELSLDDLQSIKAQLDALSGACQGLCEAKMGMLDDYELMYFSMGDRRGLGPGMGGPGIGMGGSTGELPNPPVDYVDESLGGKLDPKAPMLVSVTVRGAGDAEEMLKTDYSEVLPSFEQEAEAALEKEEIPPAYREYVRQYFEDLKKR